MKAEESLKHLQESNKRESASLQLLVNFFHLNIYNLFKINHFLTI